MNHVNYFKEDYDILNPEQRQAVDAIEGPVMVVAGPGTGKTQILTLRIANILQRTDTPPDAVLAITFTETAAKAMRDRLRRYIGADAYKVSIFTFHGFAEHVISTHQEAFARIIGGAVASDVERFEYIQTILQEATWKVLRPSGKPEHYVHSILQQISACKREYMSPDGVATWLQSLETALAEEPKHHEKGAHKGKVRRAYLDLEKKLRKHQEFLAVYRRYEALLSAQHRYDFDDLILELVRALKEDEGLLRQLQEKYLYILADEHQDVNESQNQILQCLAEYHTNPNIFVVGDEKQAIYRFQGSSLSNFLYFSDSFTNTTNISLTDNYRSGQSILDASQAVVTTEDEQLQNLRIPLSAATSTTSKVYLRRFSHTASESVWAVETVRTFLEKGQAPEEIAIIVRTNHDVETYATQLRSFGIPVRPSAEGAINQHPVVMSLRLLLRLVVDPSDETALAGVLHAPYWGLSTTDLVKVLAARNSSRSLLDVVSNEKLHTELGVTDSKPLERVCDTIEMVRSEASTLAPHRLLEQVLKQSGWLSYIHRNDPLDGARVVRRFYDAVTEGVERGSVNSLSDVVQLLRMHEQYNIPLQAPYLQQETNAVNVLTAHKAKGLEYDIVILPGLIDNVWGGSRSRNTFNIPLTRTSDPDTSTSFDDDQRLLYVAMTRAKKELHLSYANTTTNGRERLSSRLLEPLHDLEAVVEFPDMNDYETALAPTDTFGQNDPRLTVSPEVIADIFRTRGFSPTGYNNYRNDPWNFFYRNILRIPEFPNLSMLFGTTMHRVWERAVESWRNTRTIPEVTTLSEYLQQALNQLPISEFEYTQLHEQGLATIPIYRDTLTAQLRDITHSVTEQRMKCMLELGESLGFELPLTGAIDRIDRDSSGSIVRIVDYKTGKPKSRNAILGNTASSDGNYYTQLRFYATLLHLQGEHHSNIAYTLSFIEPDQHGKIKEETFFIDIADITEFIDELRVAAQEIVSGAFLNNPCDPEQCEYCNWVSLHIEN